MAKVSPQDFALLRKSRFFNRLSRSYAVELTRNATVRDVSKGSYIWRAGESADNVVVILQGRIAILAPTADRHMEVANLFQARDVLAGAVRVGRRLAFSGLALADCRILSFPASELRNRLATDLPLANAMVRLYAERLADLWAQMRDMKSLTANQRLGVYLLRLTERKTGRASFRLPDDQKIVAGLIGVTRESLSRSFAQLRSQGVEKNARMVTIKNVAALRRYCTVSVPQHA